MTASDFLPLLIVGLICVLGLIMVRARYLAWEFLLILVSLLAHLVAAFVQIWMVMSVYHTGDMLFYNKFGLELSAALQRDFSHVMPALLSLLVLGENHLNIFVPLAGTSTGNMVVLTGWGLFVLGDSMYALSVAFSAVSCFGKLALYQAFRENFPASQWPVLAFATVLLPSAIFWSAGIIKESVAITGLGILTLGVSRWFRLHRLKPVLIVAGAMLIGLVKPYILFAFALAAAAWFYWIRSAGPKGVRIRPIYLIAAASTGIIGLLLLGRLFPEYRLENLMNEVTAMQFASTRGRGGSTFLLGDPTERSLLGQLQFVPIAIYTALFRPAIFEASNPQMLLNALETTLMLFGAGRLFWSRTPADLWRAVNQRPMLIFCLVFTGVMALAVGITTSNLGTLSRYRMPMYPFFAALLAVLAFPAPVMASLRRNGEAVRSKL